MKQLIAASARGIHIKKHNSHSKKIKLRPTIAVETYSTATCGFNIQRRLLPL